MNRNDLDFVANMAGDRMEPELASVDDLQVAAAAAAAGLPSSSEEEEDTSSDESTSSDDEGDARMGSEDESESSGSDEAPQDALLVEQWKLDLHVDEADERVTVELLPQFRLSSRQALAPVAGMEVNSEYETESSDDSEEDSESAEEIEEIVDYIEIRRIVDAMDAEDSEPAGPAPSAAEQLFGAAPPPALEVAVTADDALSRAGSVLSVIEGTIVVRASPGSRALNEGSVLVLEDRTVIGAVEDIFGPVQAPLYALRYAGGGGGVPPGLKPEAPVFCVDRLAEYVLEEELRVKGYDEDVAAAEGGEGGGGAAAALEAQFSDDEAEAQYKRKLKAKRKGEREGAGGAAGAPEGKKERGSRPARPPREGAGRGGGGGGRGGRGGQQQYPRPPPRQAIPLNPPYGPLGCVPMPPPQYQQQYHAGPPQYQQQFQPGPPQYLGHYVPPPPPPAGGYAFPPQQMPMHPQQQFQAHATAGQLGAMSLQPHHMHPAAYQQQQQQQQYRQQQHYQQQQQFQPAPPQGAPNQGGAPQPPPRG